MVVVDLEVPVALLVLNVVLRLVLNTVDVLYAVVVLRDVPVPLLVAKVVVRLVFIVVLRVKLVVNEVVVANAVLL